MTETLELPELDCRSITKQLLIERYRRNFCLPRYTPSGWFECDVFELTKAGYFLEYEIKLSISDFRADSRKAKVKYDIVDGLWQNVVQPTKHQRLRTRDPLGPSAFYFVLPQWMIMPNDIPEWAGLIEAVPRAATWGPALHMIKEAPELHRQKVNPKVREHAEGVCYWRLLNHLTGQ